MKLVDFCFKKLSFRKIEAKEFLGFLDGSVVKNLLAIQERWVRSLGQEDPLEKEMATHSSNLA